MKSSEALSRRNILVGLVAGTGLFAAVSAPAFKLGLSRSKVVLPSWWKGPRPALASAGFSEWSSVIGSVFTVDGDAGAVQLSLKGVTPLNSSGTRPRSLARTSAFALEFEALGNTVPEGDRMYAVRAANFADQNIYFSPVASGSRRMQAVFN